MPSCTRFTKARRWPLIEAAFPGSTAGGKVDRSKLAAMVLNDKAALARLEAIVHPLVGAARDKFLAAAQARGGRVVVLDMPLLFETAAERPLRCRRRGLGAGRDPTPAAPWRDPA